MADSTLIEWARHPVTGKGATWNPITGCKVVSPGCTHCYAMKLAGTRLKHHPSRAGLTIDSKAGPVWNGQIRFNAEWLDQPLRWSAPRGIFVCAHGDLFAEGVTDAMLDQIFAVMALAPQHIFFVLTKRPERMRQYLTTPERDAMILEHAVSPLAPTPLPLRLPLPNVWLGVSVEDQARADERIPLLLQTPAAKRFISAEPLLGPVDWKRWLPTGRAAVSPNGVPFVAPCYYMFKCDRCGWVGSSEDGGLINYGDDADMTCPACQEICDGSELPKLDWVIAGGESGQHARPSHPDWFRSLRDQCAQAGVAFFFKQWGEWAPQVGAVDGWAIGDDPEISRFDHRDWEECHWGEPYRPMWCDDLDDDTVSRIGKKSAGHLLDGVEHFAFPEVVA